jgi:enoyl-[acyl-carrier protein] reductase I
MQLQGAEIVLTGFGRARRLTERAARALPQPPDVLELDVNSAGDLAALAADLDQRWDALDGVLHSIAYAPADIWEGSFFGTSHDSLDTAIRTSVYSLQSMTGALLPQLARSPGGASVVTLTVTSGRHSLHYSWMGIMKTALNALVKQIAVEAGPQQVRSNAIALGPMRTNASSGIPGFSNLEDQYRDRAPLGWDTRDLSIAAGPACFLLSEQSRGITGEVLVVDGGYHALL